MGTQKATGGAADAFLGAMQTVGDGVLFDFLDETPAGVGFLDPELRWVYVNPGFLEVTGLERADILGRRLDATPFAPDTPTVRRLLSRRRRGAAVDGVAAPDVAGSSGDWRVRYQRLQLDHQTVGVIAAVSGPAGGAPEQRRHLDLARRLAMQEAVTEHVGTTLDLDVTCGELADFTVPTLADLTTVAVMPYEVADHSHHVISDAPRMRRAALACASGLRQRLGSLAAPGLLARPAAESAVSRCLREGRPVVANLLSDEELAEAAATDDLLAAYRIAGVGSVLAVPLSARGRLVGVMTLTRVRGRSQAFSDEDVALVQDLAHRAAVSIENARQYTDSQSITLQLQRALLVEPGRPHANLDVVARYLPSGNSSLVGGDWYEIVRLAFGRTLLVMGDVMGHGVEAAVDMSNYRSAIRDAGGMDLSPRGILKHLDDLISKNESARPATCLLVVADPNRGRWTFTSAGHLPPAVFVPGQPTRLVDIPAGPPLGTGLGDYEQTVVDFAPGQVLLLYTDGLVERRDEDIDASLARLASLALPASGRLDDLLDVALRDIAPAAAEDDIALLAARAADRSD
jgi:serine phosphatase RsbU (regulator of sigma subunit)